MEKSRLTSVEPKLMEMLLMGIGKSWFQIYKKLLFFGSLLNPSPNLSFYIHTYKDKEKNNMKFTYRSVFEATLAKENTSVKSKSMNKSGNDDLNGSALELQPIMDNEALIHNRVRIYQFRDVG